MSKCKDQSTLPLNSPSPFLIEKLSFSFSCIFHRSPPSASLSILRSSLRTLPSHPKSSPSKLSLRLQCASPSPAVTRAEKAASREDWRTPFERRWPFFSHFYHSLRFMDENKRESNWGLVVLVMKVRKSVEIIECSYLYIFIHCDPLWMMRTREYMFLM